MAETSSIEWTEATWNPVVGCTKVSPGCDHCYAERITERFHGKGSFAVVQRSEDKLYLPLRWRKPRRIFVNSMSDLFHDDVPDSFIAKAFGVMAATPHHTYQLLTKRHGRMRSLLKREDFRERLFLANNLDQGDVLGDRWPLPNVWLGVSVEDQKRADLRVPALLDTPAAVRWLSMEPLLGPVDLWNCGGVSAIAPDWAGGPRGGTGAPHPLVDWVVVGGESGPGARPMHPDWVRQIRDVCVNEDVPFFFKQFGEWAPVGPLFPQGDDHDEQADAVIEAAHLEVVERRRVIQLERSGYVVEGHQPTDPRTWLMARVGKKAAGRLLDGVLHDAYPEVARVSGDR